MVKMLPEYHDLHIHTVFSDGSTEVEDVVRRASELRIGAIGITDHFWPSLGGRRGGKKLIERRREIIEEMRAAHPHMLILDGAEVDVQSDGTLAPVAGGLEQFDLVIASIHFQCSSSQWVSLIRRLVSNEFFHILGHWDGYLSSFRQQDGEVVASLLAKAGVAVELSARYETRHPEFLEAARDAGCKFTFGSDAHWVDEVGRIGDLRTLARDMRLSLLSEIK